MAFREGINEELFEAALDFIDKHPRSFDMVEYQQETECGTVFCLAGVVCALVGHDPGYLEGADAPAARALGLRRHEADCLFQDWDWPSMFADSISSLEPGAPEYKDVAIRRFRHFLATGE